MARRKRKSADVSVLADVPRVLADAAGMTTDPASGGNVSKIDKITFSCEDNIAPNVDPEAVVVYDDEGDEVAYGAEWSDNSADGVAATEVYLTISPVVTAEGNYTIFVPAGAFILGDDHSSTEIDLDIWVDGSGAKVTIPLTDLDGVVTGSAYVTPAEGSGDGAVSVTADAGNEGLDRSGVVTFHTTSGAPTISVARSIVQLGLREPFAGSDGDFIVADGGTHHVLKEENK